MTCSIDLLSRVGGKAANLQTLRDRGFPVPEFIVIETWEYAEFLRDHALTDVIDAALAGSTAADASERIRAAFRVNLSGTQRDRLATRLGPLLGRPLAVRSSATAEDLPDLSFAGQQDTFLDVVGLEAALVAIVECWSSLWTERAIGYRDRAGVRHDDVAIAVVVQEMVDAEVSGVLFTADPMTGHRGHTVIDAVRGLGEALVAGEATPDNVVVDSATGDVLSQRVIGPQPVLTADAIADLVAIGRRVAAAYGTPQDIEWVRRDGLLSLVQSRPVTSLYPLPEPDPSVVDAGVRTLWLSYSAFEGHLAPLTPFGQDVSHLLHAGAWRLFGRSVDYRANPFVAFAGGRLWVRIDQFLRRDAGRRIVPKVLASADPVMSSIVTPLLQEEAFAVVPQPGSSAARARVRAVGRLARFARPHVARIPGTLRAPDAARADLDLAADSMLAELIRALGEAALKPTPAGRLTARLGVLEAFGDSAIPTIVPPFARVMLPVALLTRRLQHVARRTGLPDADALALGVLRSLPGNVTTEMDLALWSVARAIRDDAPARARFAEGSPADLASDCLAGRLPRPAQEAVDAFLAAYGMRGEHEMDLGAPNWAADPEGVMATLSSYVSLPDSAAPDAAYARGAIEAQAAIDTLATARGRLRGREVRFLASRLRTLSGGRDTPTFALVRALGMLRNALCDSGADLVASGAIDSPDDVFFLYADDLASVFDAAFDTAPLRAVIAERRAEHERESRRTRVPLVLVGDGRTFFEGTTDATGELAGTGVSPGVVEGPVRVVDDPRTSGLRPGEILVCRATNPAWTPLFLSAGGVVTQIGGLMSHGSVVAREYGIPAVVGVNHATERLVTGQRIRLDGTSGSITVLEEDEGGR
ncbi:MAG: PEP/pyruvate-binding domain-containing protein [Dermatophilaceae bacterium]